MSAPLLQQLAERLARPIAESERKRARMHLLDWMACVAGGRSSEAAVLGSAISQRPWESATYFGNALEMDDVHRTALLHPGPVVWPAAMSMESADLETRLNAAIRGYEAMIAIGSALDAHHYAHWHPTTTAGVFGSTVAFGSLFGFAPVEYAHAMANAGSVAGGFWHMRHDDVLTKQWHIHHAVRTGREAALHVNYGLTGPLRLLEGEQGLFAGFTKNAGTLGEAPDGGWLMREVSLKPFAACRHAHPAIDAAMKLRQEGRLEAPFTVETYQDALTFCDRPDPATELDAKFSLQHAIAVVADGRDAVPSDFTPEAIAQLAPLRAQVSVRHDPAFTQRYPAHFGARVNGLELVDTLGDPERPVSVEQLRAKMHELAKWGSVSEEDAAKTCTLSLESNDAAGLDSLLEKWTR